MAIGKLADAAKIETTDLRFPKDIADFKLFYQILVVICKMGIAKHDITAIQK